MGIWDWFAQNWFNLFSSVGIIAGLWFTATSLRSEARTRRVANLLTITDHHRKIWQDFSEKPNLKRVVSPDADLVKQPVTEAEETFVNMVILHINSVYYATNDHLVVEYEGLRRDIDEFFSLPIPRAVWRKAKPKQNRDFARFIETAIK